MKFDTPLNGEIVSLSFQQPSRATAVPERRSAKLAAFYGVPPDPHRR